MLQNSPIRNAGRTWTRDNSQKANRFQKHLEMIFQPNDEEEDDDKWIIPITESINIVSL